MHPAYCTTLTLKYRKYSVLNATYICTAVYYRYIKNYSEVGRGQREREKEGKGQHGERGKGGAERKEKRGDDDRRREEMIWEEK